MNNGFPKPEFIFKFGNRKKDLALHKRRDWLTGLSFTQTPFGDSFKYRVSRLEEAGFIVRPDAHQPATILWTNVLYVEPNIGESIHFPDEHVSVWHRDRQYWDAWYQADLTNYQSTAVSP